MDELNQVCVFQDTCEMYSVGGVPRTWLGNTSFGDVEPYLLNRIYISISDDGSGKFPLSQSRQSLSHQLH